MSREYVCRGKEIVNTHCTVYTKRHEERERETHTHIETERQFETSRYDKLTVVFLLGASGAFKFGTDSSSIGRDGLRFALVVTPLSKPLTSEGVAVHDPVGAVDGRKRRFKTRQRPKRMEE